MKQIFGLVPAAGSGVRMQADRPKQHLLLGGRTLLQRSLDALLADARVGAVYVVVAPGDTRVLDSDLPSRCVLLPQGGATRAASVHAGLAALRAVAGPQAWVLVHDAARPCLSAQDLAALIDRAGAQEGGGLLATPLGDTLKRATSDRSVQTVPREGLWRALTPQFFALDILWRALEACGGAAADGITDEASAVERLGLQPLLVPGSAANIKVTTPDDLALAQAILAQQGRW